MNQYALWSLRLSPPYSWERLAFIYSSNEISPSSFLSAAIKNALKSSALIEGN